MYYKKILLIFYSFLISGFCIGQTLDQFNAKITEYYNKGEYDDAIIIAEQVKDSTFNKFGNSNLTYCKVIRILGVLYANKGNYKMAESYDIEALSLYKNLLGIEHIDYAISLNNLGLLYSDIGDYKRGEYYLLKAMPILKKQIGSYATLLSNIGLLYTKMGEYKKAELYYLETLAIDKNILGIKHPDYASSLNDLGSLYIEMGDYKKAKFYLLEAMVLRKTIIGIRHPQYATSLQNLGGLFLEMGDYKKAKFYLLEAMTIYKNILGIEHPYYAISLNTIASLYSDLGDYKQAETFYLEALNIRKKILGTNHPDYANSLNNLGVLYFSMSEFEKSKACYLEALAIKKKLFGTENPQYIKLLSDLGILYSDLGDYKKAETLLLKADSLTRNASGQENLNFLILNNLAIIYWNVADYKKTESSLLQALVIIKKMSGMEKAEYASVLNNLGTFYSKFGNYKKALLFLLEALHIRKITVGSEHPDYAKSLNSLGQVYIGLKEYKKGERYFLDALSINKQLSNTQNTSYANNLTNLGSLYSQMREYKKAEFYYQEALSIRRKIIGMQHPDYAASLKNLGWVYYDIGKITRSIDYLNQALAIININIKQNFDFLSEKQKISYLMPISDVYNLYNSVFFQSFPQLLKQSSTLFNNELQNKGLILHYSQQIRNAIYNQNDSSLIYSWKQMLLNKQQLSKIYSLPKDKYPTNVHELEEQIESLDKKLVKQSQEYRYLHENFHTNSKLVQQNLKNNEAAIEFISFHYFSRQDLTDSILYAALILKPEYSQPKYVYLFEENQLLSIIKKPEGSLDQSYINNLYKNQEGNPLYQLIWKPLDSLLQGVTTVYAAPSGLLHKIALGAIPTIDSNTISNKYGLEILGTTGDIINKKEDFIDKKSVQQAIVFGGINYDIASSWPIDFTSNSTNNVYAYVPTDSTRSVTGKWDYLGGTLKEAEDIARQFNEQKITTHFYSDSTATETLFKNMPINTSSVIHIATHGYFFPDVVKKQDNGIQLMGEEKQSAFKVSDNPLLRSGLIFAGANPTWTNPDYLSTASDDGILTAYEISNMDLSNVKLVVLSACETGLGDIKGSEGVFGLQRSFKLAGVKNIIMSLWKVPDEKTRELMGMFYQFCFKGKSINDAFKSAQEEMRNKYPASPYYWAGFTLLQ